MSRWISRTKTSLQFRDLDGVVKRIVFPQAFLGDERFELNEEHRNFILKYMSMLPGESDFPSYPQAEYTDSYSKFFKFGTDKNPIPGQAFESSTRLVGLTVT
jgi:hypothetical protein